MRAAEQGGIAVDVEAPEIALDDPPTPRIVDAGGESVVVQPAAVEAQLDELGR